MKKKRLSRDEYLDMDEASSYLGMTKGSLYVYVSKGEIGHIKVGSRTYFTLEQLDSYLSGKTRIVEPKESE